MLKTSLSLIILIWAILQSCNSLNQDPDQSHSDKPLFKVSDQGDTILINYRDNGSLISEIPVKNGLKNGVAINYYENGKIQNEISYKDGRKNGRVTWNYESGALYRESFYVDGKIEGLQKKYYEDGKLMAEIPYLSDELQTGTREYSSDGKLKKQRPEIIFTPIDKVAFENLYYLRISLSKKQKDTKFSRLVENDGQVFRIPLVLTEGYTEIKWNVPKGTIIMEKIRISAEFITSLGNPMRIEKTYSVGVENR